MPRLLPACLCALLLLPTCCRAQPFVEHLQPPVLQRGKTTRLTVVGSRLAKSLDLWTSLAGGAVRATVVDGSKAGSASFDVRVAADAPVGLFGLRVVTADGLSNAHICLIDDLPVRPAPASDKGPTSVVLPAALWGRLKEATVDTFAIQVKAGQRVSFEAVGNRFGKEVDPLLVIRDARKQIVAERDNDVGLYFDCRFEHTFVVAGTYTVEVRDSRFQGHEHGFYVLRMGRFPAARVAVPAVVRPGKRDKLLLPELNETLDVELPARQAAGPLSLALRRSSDEGSTWLPVVAGGESFVAAADAVTADKATPAKVPGRLCGVLRKPGQRQFFRLTLVKGQTIYAIGHGRWLNSSIEIGMALTDDAGRIVRQANDGANDTVRLDFTAPKAGVYCLAVRDVMRDGGLACAYRVEVLDIPPPPLVVAEVEGLTVPRGSYQVVPLTVTRNGYTGPVALTLTGTPAGVVLTPSEIPAGVDVMVCKLSAGSSTTLGLHTLQIQAQAIKAPAAPKTLVRTRPLVDRQLLNVDLIPYSLREDQLRLPPSLTDRLALQVTEAGPFTFDLADKLITLPRYQQAAIPIITTRKPDFDGPISFTARGGQLADKEEGRTRVYAEFPQATAKTLKVAGSVHSRILANLGRTRIEVLASAVHAGRKITLIRTFDLEIRTAFTVTAEPALVKIAAGAEGRVRVKVDRVTTFTGPVTVELSPVNGLELPEKVVIPRGQTSVDIKVKVHAEATPGRRGISLMATGDVDGFEEEQRGRFDIEVPRPEKPKK